MPDRVEVRCYAGGRGEETPRAVLLGGREVTVHVERARVEEPVSSGGSASASSPPAATRRSDRRTVAWLTANCSAIWGTAQPWSRSCTHCRHTRRRGVIEAWRSRPRSSACWSGDNWKRAAGLGMTRACPNTSPNANAYTATTSFSDTLQNFNLAMHELVLDAGELTRHLLGAAC
jgi:hypothetical protein